MRAGCKVQLVVSSLFNGRPQPNDYLHSEEGSCKLRPWGQNTPRNGAPYCTYVAVHGFGCCVRAVVASRISRSIRTAECSKRQIIKYQSGNLPTFLFFLPIIVSVACPTGPHPPLRLARRPNRDHIYMYVCKYVCTQVEVSASRM